MLFNSIDFALFLPIVFLLHWLVFQRNVLSRNLLLTAASFLFYGWWDWRFLVLMIWTASIDYLLAILIERTTRRSSRNWLLAGSLISNLGVLFFFKYYDFFVQSFVESYTFFGGHLQASSLNIVLPVGISFYTFQALSYTIDVYRGNMKATRDYVGYLTFISFFPQLVAGPIERATKLLPQFTRLHAFDYEAAVDGSRRIAWGLFKKMLVADNCASAVDVIFASANEASASSLVVGAVLFAFQIYCDFSGYSDIAIGTARLFGIELTQNFSTPYFSRTIPEFWRRWHISLSTWFKDYVYIPLGGNRRPMRIQIRNIFVVFVVSGLWHGANWTFVAWGLIHAIVFTASTLLGRSRPESDVIASNRALPTLWETVQLATTFAIVTLSWIFFRSGSVSEAVDYIRGMASPTLFSIPKPLPLRSFLMITVLLVVEWIQRKKSHGLDFGWASLPAVARWAVYIVICLVIFVNMAPAQQFIYFQF